MRRFLLSLILLCLSALAFSQENLEQSASITFGQDAVKPVSAERFTLSGMYSLAGESFSAQAGLQMGCKDFNTRMQGVYWPLSAGNWTFGAGLIYDLNLHWIYGFTLTNNILPGIYFKWQPSAWYRMELHTDALIKLRTIHAIHETLINLSLAFEWKNCFMPSENFMLYVKLSSIEDYSYKILFAPSFATGAEYRTGGHMSYALETVIRYQDFFTLSALYNTTVINFTARYTW